MKVSLGLPTHRVELGDELAGPVAVAEIGRAAEQAGFDAVFVTDHPAPPDSWLASGGHHTLDPLVTLAFVAAATSTLRLQTNLYVAAYRHPLLSAKAVATLDSLSGGRVILGIGAGYLEEEFAALGADFESRNDRTDDAIRLMQRAWTGDSVDGVTLLPRPVQRPHPPIWIGGNSKRAIRRAVELGDGWVPMPNPARSAHRRRTPALESLDDLAPRLAYARDHAAAIGRTRPFEVVFMPLGLDMFSGAPFDAAATKASLAALAEAGVTYATVSLPADSRRELLAAIDQFGCEVLRG